MSTLGLRKDTIRYQIMKTVDKEFTFLLGIFVVATLPIFVYSNQSVLSQSQTLPIVSDGLIALVEHQMTYYNFSVPEDAVIPRLIGYYNVPSGLDIEVAVLDMEECAQDSYISVYYAINRTSGDVDVSLTPSKTYHLGFLSPESFAGERIVEVDFYVQYD